MTLAFDTFGPEGEGVPELWLLHGILGSRRNWRAFARQMSKQVPAWRIVTVDLRGHGDSPGGPAPHTLEACVQDLAELAAQRGAGPTVLCGHSFGGKVALVAARTGLTGLQAVWDIDAPPGAHDVAVMDAGEIGEVLRVVRAEPGPFTSFEAVAAPFIEAGLARGIAGWMTTNVERAANGLVWRFDLEVIEELLVSYAHTDAWDAVEAAPLPMSLVRGGRSDRWTDGDIARLDAAADASSLVALHVFSDAGHWVHVDAASELMNAMAADLRSVSKGPLQPQ